MNMLDLQTLEANKAVKAVKAAIKTMSTRAIQEMADMHREALHVKTETPSEQRAKHEHMLELYVWELKHRKHKR